MTTEDDGWITVYSTPPMHLRPCPNCKVPVGPFGVLVNAPTCVHLQRPLSEGNPWLDRWVRDAT